MTLKELGEKYLKQAEVINNKIISETERLKELDCDGRLQANKRIKMLYEMRSECTETAHRLIHYYDTSSYKEK